MKVTGVVIDNKTGEPMPGASVFVADANSKPTGDGVLAGDDGKFSLDSADLDSPQSFLGVSYVGYKDELFIPGNSGPYSIKMEPDITGSTGGMAAVEVVAKRKPKPLEKKKQVWPWIVGGVVVAGTGIWLYYKYGRK